MEKTENISLSLPSGSDSFNIQDFDNNYQIIDEEVTINKSDMANMLLSLGDISQVYDACDYLNSTPEDISLSSIITAINNIELIPMPPLITGNAYTQTPTRDSYFLKHTEYNSDEAYEYDTSYYATGYHCPGTYLFMPASINEEVEVIQPLTKRFNHDDLVICIRFKYQSISNASGKLFILGNYDNLTSNRASNTTVPIEGIMQDNANIVQMVPGLYVEYSTNTLKGYLPNDPYFMITAPSFQVSPNTLYTVVIKIDAGRTFCTMLFNDSKELIDSQYSQISNWDNLPFDFCSPFSDLYEKNELDNPTDQSYIIFGNNASDLGFIPPCPAYGLYIDTINTFIANDNVIIWGDDVRKMLPIINRISYTTDTSISQMICMTPDIESSSDTSMFVKYKEYDPQGYWSEYYVSDKKLFLGVPYHRYDTDNFYYQDDIVTFYIRFKYIDSSGNDYEYLLGNYSPDEDAYDDNFKRTPEIYIEPSTNKLYINNSDYFTLIEGETYYIVLRLINEIYVKAFLFDEVYTFIDSLDISVTWSDLPYDSNEDNFYPCFGGSITSYYSKPENRASQSNAVAIDFKNTFWTYNDEIFWGLDTLDIKDDYEFPNPTPEPTPLDIGTNYIETQYEEDLMYTFTPDESGYYHIYSVDPDDSTGYSINPSLTISYEGSQIGYDNDSGTGYNFDIITEMESGNTYDLDLYTSYGTGYLDIIIETYNPEPPPGPTPDSLVMGDNEVDVYDEVSSDYTFTPYTTGYYHFYSTIPDDPDGYSINPVIQIYDGSSKLIEDDDSGTGYNFDLTTELIGGTTYDVKLRSDYSTGYIVVSIESDSPEPPTPSEDELIVGDNNVEIKEEQITYTFTPYTTGYYHFYSENSEDPGGYSVDPEITIMDGSSVIVNDNDSGTGYNFDITTELTAGTTYNVLFDCNNNLTGYVTVSIQHLEPVSTTLSLGDNEVILREYETIRYNFTPSETGYYYFHSSIESDPSGWEINPYIYIYDNGTELGEDDDGAGTGYNFALSAGLTGGTTYDIDLYSSYGEGNLTVTIESISFDENLSVGTNNVRVPKDSGNSVDCYFTPSSSGEYHIYSEGEDINPILDIYDSEDNQVGGDDDSGSNSNFDCTIELEANEQYRFNIYYYSTNGSMTMPVIIEMT